VGIMKLDGLRVLVVEDEALIAMLIEDTLADLGCLVVGVAPTLEEALQRISSLTFDAAILDVNLNGDDSYPAAMDLARRRIPFVFSTGYGAVAIPEPLKGVPFVVKPFEASDLERVLTAVLQEPREAN